jgi:hypothetical protein
MSTATVVPSVSVIPIISGPSYQRIVGDMGRQRSTVFETPKGPQAVRIWVVAGNDGGICDLTGHLPRNPSATVIVRYDTGSQADGGMLI